MWYYYFGCICLSACGPGSTVGIATGYVLDGPGIESRWEWGDIFRTCPDRPRGPPSLLYNGYRVFPGVNSGRGVTLTPHPLLVPLVMKEYSYKSTSPIGRTACTEPQCLYKGDLYLYYLVSPSKRNLRATRLIDIQWNIKGLGIISKTHMHISGIIASSPHPV